MKIGPILSFIFIGVITMTMNNAQAGGLKLPAIFSDHMVLQQRSAVKFWGQAAPSEKIRIQASWGKTGQTLADLAGNWNMTIKTPVAGGPYTITIAATSEKRTLQNVLIGEVWLCSGQSNMEMPLMGWPPNDLIVNSEAEIQNANFPEIRLFTVSRAVSHVPLNDCNGKWQVCNPESVQSFSATAYFFGKALYKSLRIPIGLVHTSWGGTTAQAWTSAHYLSELPEFAPIIQKIRNSEDQFIKYQQWLDNHPQISVADKNPDLRWLGLDFQDAICSQKDYDDGAWPVLTLPIVWEQTEIGPFDGVIWFRREIDVPAEWQGQPLMLELGPIDDMDITYVNGQRVGSCEQPGFWQTERKYPVPADLVKPGKNTIAVRVLDTQGGGGIFGKPEQMKLYPQLHPEQALALAAAWRYLPVAQYKNGVFYVFNVQGNAYFSRPPVEVQLSSDTPSFLYNAMIAPLIPFTLKGVIWYQGESNAGNPKQYQTLFPLLIKNWRADWQRNFPFYFVQIAPYDYGESTRSQELREAQMLSLAVPHTGMAVTLDIGNNRNIHPANKQDVGKRLALWALAQDYNQKLVYSGPIYKKMKVEGNKIRLFFDHVGTGLMAKDGKLNEFEIAGPDQNFRPATAEIAATQVLVFHPEIANPVAVRYAWSNTAGASLFNKQGLPASSFRTDNW